MEYYEYKKTANTKDNSPTNLNNENLNSLETTAIQHKPESSEWVRSAMVSMAPSNGESFTYGIVPSAATSASMTAGKILFSTMR